MRAHETICNPIELELYFLSLLCFMMTIMPVNQRVMFQIGDFWFQAGDLGLWGTWFAPNNQTEVKKSPTWNIKLAD